MLERIRKATEDKERGFTLIELLVVVIIIGILAAIAIPTFLNQRENGYKAQAQSDLRNAASAIESWAVDKNGSYATLTTAEVQNLVTESTGVTVTLDSTSATTYCIEADHASLSAATDFHFRKTTGTPATGAC